MADLIADKTLVAKFLLDTLEGTQSLAKDSVVCIGIDNDAWQQTTKALLKKYNVTTFTEDGWMICEPKPEAVAECCEITADLMEGQTEFEVVGQWGKKQDDGTHLQYGVVGDYICRQPHDHTDVWRVARKFFINTYAILDATATANIVELQTKTGA